MAAVQSNRFGEGVRKEINSDNQRAQHKHRPKDSPGLNGQDVSIFGNHEAPVRGWGCHAKAQERERGEGY